MSFTFILIVVAIIFIIFILKGYYENWNLEREGTFKNGELEGPIKNYDENGEVYTEEN